MESGSRSFGVAMERIRGGELSIGRRRNQGEDRWIEIYKRAKSMRKELVISMKARRSQ